MKTWNEGPDVSNKHIQVNGEKQVIKKPAEEQRIAASFARKDRVSLSRLDLQATLRVQLVSKNDAPAESSSGPLRH